MPTHKTTPKASNPKFNEDIVQPPTLRWRAIAHVEEGVIEPREDFWRDVESTIILNPEVYDASALEGLEQFSHVDVLFFFHTAVRQDKPIHSARHPRGNTHLPKVGILAQRAKSRVNHIGLTRCQVVRMAETRLTVRGLDAYQGSPIIDIKPAFVTPSHSADVRQPAWVDALMKDYWKADTTDTTETTHGQKAR